MGEKHHFSTTRLFLVVTFARETPFFGDETLSRRHFCSGNSIFWRRDHFSSPFLGEKHHFSTTRLFLVVTFARETPFFGDETLSRRHFCSGNSIFLATRPLLVTFLSRKMLIFGDETSSRRHFGVKNSLFWRRDLFSSPFLGEKHHFSTTKLFLVVILSWKTPLFGDETSSRHLFWAKNTIFRRRNSFSSSLLLGKLHFLATRPLLVTFLSRKMLIFGDETSSRRHFGVKNSLFWRRDPFSSSLLLGKLTFLATRLILVTFFGRKSGFFGDETPRRDAKSCFDKPKTCS